MSTLKIKKQKSLFRILIISFLSGAALIILFISILFILFLVYKNDISKTFLLSVNQKINGKVTFSNLSFSPFKHFPNASLKFDDLTLYESKDSALILVNPPVFNIEEAYVSVNLVDLFSSKINISEINFEGGRLNLMIYPDSLANIQKAIKIITKKDRIPRKSPIKKDTLKKIEKSTAETTRELTFQIDNLNISDLTVSAENQLNKNKTVLKIDELSSDLSYKGNQVIFSLDLSTTIDSLLRNNVLLLANKKFKLKSKFDFDTDRRFAKLDEGSFRIDEAEFLFSGIFDLNNHGYLDLTVSGSEKKFGLFPLFISNEGMRNFKSGRFSFRCSVRGKTFVGNPLIDLSFKVNNANMINPVTNREIKNLSFQGEFHSGIDKDWSDAKLKIDTLYADLPTGFINLSGSVRNFKVPKVDLNIFCSADVTGLEKVFDLDFIKNIKGRIDIKDRFKGNYISEEKRFSTEINQGNISFQDFGFNIPGALNIDKMNGSISRTQDDYYFNNLDVVSEGTDFQINGKIENLHYLIFNIDKEINADLTIKSSIFDLPNFLAFDPSIKRDFPYRILDVDIDVKVTTTTSKALNFKSFPEIDLDIKNVDATVENFLPRLKVESGRFKVSEDLLGFNLKFDNFKTKFLNGEFNFTGEYNTSKFQPFYIKVQTNFTDISPSVLFYDTNDSIPESLSGKLSGSFFTEFQFPIDSTFLKFISLKNGNLVYHSAKDTIELRSVSFNFSDIYFNKNSNVNLLATLSTKGNFKANKILTKYFILDKAKLDINVSDGEYEIGSGSARLFGERAKGKSYWKIKPFTRTPTYHIKYDVTEFYAEDMFSIYLEDTVVTGPLSLFMDISSSGTDWDNILNNMNGKINLSGKNLKFYGLDADKLIEKFKRSQSFNLIDLGAVMLAGPVGIAVTKGTDFARIFMIDSGESSEITRMISHWDIDKGNFIIQDAAFTTNKNRVAAKGFIDFFQNSLDLSIALLNINGCSIFTQRVYGDLNSPTLGNVKVVGSILAPVTNLIDDILGIDCDVFYKGVVKPPKN